MTPIIAILLAQSAARVLTLEEAQNAARQNQPQLRAAHASTSAAEGRVEQSRSGLLPQLSATAGYERSTINYLFRPGGVIRTGQSATWDAVNVFDSSVTLSQLVWDFGQTSDRWRSSQAGARATAEQEFATGLQVVLQVRVAFFNAVAARQILAVARETLANQRNHLVQIQEFVHAGTRPPIDLSQAQADFANAEVQAINAMNAYQRTKVLLNQVMGEEGPVDYEVAQEMLPPQPGEDGTLDAILEGALDARPELAAAKEQVRTQQYLLQSARGTYWPSIAAGAGLVQSTATGTGYIGWDVSAGVTLTWNIFQGGLTKGMVHEAEGNLAYAAAQVDVVRQQVRVDVDQALLAIRAAKAASSSSRNALRAARQRLSLAEGRYQNGSGSVIELGDAQIAAASAAAQVVQTDFQLATARAQLLWAQGRS